MANSDYTKRASDMLNLDYTVPNFVALAKQHCKGVVANFAKNTVLSLYSKNALLECELEELVSASKVSLVTRFLNFSKIRAIKAKISEIKGKIVSFINRCSSIYFPTYFLNA